MKRSSLQPSTKPLIRKKPMNRGTSELKRSPFQSAKKELHRDALRHGSKRLRKRSVPPTKEEREWMAWVAGYGCVVCRINRNLKVRAEVHHIVEGGRRLGHLMTIGLCRPGHHQHAGPDSGMISRHPWKKRFEAAYGTEYELHAYLVEQRKIELGESC